MLIKNYQTTFKITFKGIHKSYTNYHRDIFTQIEVVMDQPMCLGFVVLEVSNLFMYETQNDKLQPYFGE